MKNADLHTHSIYSDGRMTPTQVVAIAKKRKVKYLALADHNSTQGLVEAIRECKKARITLIPSVEISAAEDDLLGHNIDYKNKKFQKELLDIRKRYENDIKRTIASVNTLGFKLKHSDLLKKFSPATNMMKSHIARYLCEKLNMDYQEVRKKYLSHDSKYYIPVKKISIIKAIQIVKNAGGTPTLAHPWVEPESRALLKEKTFKKLVDAGLKGIEIDNGDRDSRRTPQILAKIRTLAKKYRLIITSGSDFHGSYLAKISPHHDLGKSNCDEKIAKFLLKY